MAKYFQFGKALANAPNHPVITAQKNKEQVTETNIKEKIAKIVGVSKGSIDSRFKEAQQIILNKMKAVILQAATGAISEKVSSSMCERLDSIETLQDRLNTFSEKTANTVTKLLNTIERLLAPISRLLGIINIILSIPIPTSVPPGIGIPVSVINGFNNIRNKIGSIVAIITEIVNSIRALVAALQQALAPALSVLGKINEVIAFATAYCVIKDGLEEEDYELSDLLNDAEENLSDALGLIQSELDGGDSSGFDDTMNDLLDNFIDMDAEDLLPDGIKSRLRRRAIIGDFDDVNNPNTGAGDGLDGFGDDGGLGGDGTGSGVDTGTGDGLGADGDGFGGTGPGGGNNLPPNSILFTAIDGQIYLLSVKEDPLSPQVARRRFGTAQNWNNGDPGAVVLKSPLTFTPKPKIILDDIKIRLNTQLTLL